MRAHSVFHAGLLLILAAVFLCGAGVPAFAEEAPAVYGSVTAARDAEAIDLGGQTGDSWDGFLAFLRQLPRLRQVDMFETVVTPEDIDLLVREFPDIRFGWTIHFARNHTIRTDATAFSTLHGACSRHSSSDFAVLQYCTELRALDLGHNNITDISFLRSMPELRVLILADNARLTGAEVIGELEHLEYLELFSCNQTDVSFLSGLTHLTDLNIAWNRIGDLSVLAEMPQLRRLWISKAGRIGKDTLASLQSALPDCEIMTQGEPTMNGWREHPHYDTIYEIFHTDAYLPFDDAPDD